MESDSLVKILVSVLTLILGGGGFGVWLKYRSDMKRLGLDEKKNLEEARYREVVRMEKQYGVVTTGFEKLLEANSKEFARINAMIEELRELADEQGDKIIELKKMEEECSKERKELYELKAQMLKYQEKGI